MARELIEQWAREADEVLDHPPRPPKGVNDLLLMRDERLAALVAAHEREQIAAHYGAQPHVEHFGSNIADEIRARK